MQPDCVCVCAPDFGSRCQRIMAETERGTQLTTVVLDGDVVGQQLVLASHTNEQRTSSPVGAAEGRERISAFWTHTHARTHAARCHKVPLLRARRAAAVQPPRIFLRTPFFSSPYQAIKTQYLPPSQTSLRLCRASCVVTV